MTRGGVYDIKNANDLSKSDKKKLLDVLIDLHQQERKARETIDKHRIRSKLELMADLAATPRALIATADLSTVLRQGALLTASRPVKALKSFARSLKSAFSQHSADEINLSLLSRPQAQEAKSAGLYMATLDRLDMANKEERFQSNFAERIKGWGAVVRGTERHMVVHLNLLRAAAIDEAIADLNRRGITDSKERLEYLKPIASYINAASGRGSLGDFERSAKGMATVFFAPRYAISRPESVYRAAIAVGSNKIAAKFVAKDFASFVGMGLSILTLASLAGFDVGVDPDNSDFGKIIIGDTRIDIWAGFTPVVRLLVNYMRAAGDKVPVVEDFIKDAPDRRALQDQTFRFFMYKASPTISIPAEIISGEDAVGNESSLFNYDPLDDIQNPIFTNSTPLVFQSAIETLMSDNPENALFTIPLETLGVSSSTYKRKKSTTSTSSIIGRDNKTSGSGGKKQKRGVL